MHLYNLTLQKAQSITNAVYGSFSEPNAEEIVVARGKHLEVFFTDENTGKLNSLLCWECFGIIRCMLSFRLSGSEQDYLVIGTDSGSLVIIRYSKEKNCFEIVQNEIFGKTGCRRIVPGQYLAKDPKGRAIMVGAIEKQKLVYILDRDSNANLIVSSPLEAHKASTICFDMVGLDVEYENPVFACLEIDFSALEELDLKPEERVARKIVTFYELDLGLNTVTRKQLVEVDPQANMLACVPGGDEGPGGCLVFSANWVIFISEDQEDQVRAPFPRRFAEKGRESKDLLISCVTTHVQKDMFFFLAQSELGDLYKITLNFEKETVNNIFVKYFDTIPTASAICVSRLGFLFAASEAGEHYLFTFKGIGDEKSAQTDQTSEDIVCFEPDPLRNLAVTDEQSSLAPIIDLKVLNLAREASPQVYALCGRGTRSSLRVLRYGLEVTEMAVSNVPGTPTAVWSVKKSVEDEFDSFIVVSFATATLVLSIGEMVEEISDSGFLSDTITLLAATVGSDTLMQVHPNGIRLVCADSRVNEWKPPARKSILSASSNGVQVGVILTGGEVVLFEMDSSNTLAEVTRCEMGVEVTCLVYAPVPEGNLRARFMAIGGSDRRVRLLDLEGPEDDLEPKLASTQMLEGAVTSLVLSPSSEYSSLQLFVGTADGRMATSVVDLADGKLSSGRQRYLGSEKVNLFSIRIEESSAVLALSSRPWLCYTLQGQRVTMPLAYPTLDHAATFCSEQCRDGVVSVCGQTLRIWTLEKLSDFFHSTVFPLRYTPRAMTVHPVTNTLIIAEAEHNTIPFDKRKPETRAKRQKKRSNEADGEEGESDEEEKKRKEAFKSIVANDTDDWGSCIRLFSPEQEKTIFIEEMSSNTAVFCLTTCIFQVHPNEIFLIVGAAQNVKFQPSRSSDKNFIRVYRFFDNHSTFKLLHETEVLEIPTALCAFQGMLLSGIGNILRLYDLGKRKLLRKSENRQFTGSIRKIQTIDNKIFVTDMVAGIFLVKYNPMDKSMKIYADTVTKFYSTASVVLDYDTVAAADKFGNFTVVRIRGDDDDKLKATMNIPYGGYLNSASIKFFNSVNFYVGDTITSLDKTVLNPGGAEVIIYSTILGGIGCFYPLRTREDVNFFVHLESHMRQNSPSISGRRHIDFRSSYFPVKACVDGDLCEQFTALTREVQKHVSDEMVMSDPNSIQKRLEIVRSHII